MKKIFISYVREDYKIAKRLYDDLKEVKGLKPWIDTEDLRVGEDWKFRIRWEIKKSSYFLALLSSNSISKKGYAQKELKIALDIRAGYPKSEIFILPIRLDNCKPRDEELQNMHWGDLFPSYKNGLREILKVVTNGEYEKNDENVIKKAKQKWNNVIIAILVFAILIQFWLLQI